MANFSTNTKNVIRPFGTGTSCIDSIFGECKENVSLNDCINYCKNSKYCNFGVHVNDQDKTICLPLSSANYVRPLSYSLVNNKNDTKLSNNVTFFYDTIYADIDKEVPKSLIFSGQLVQLKFCQKGKSPLYMHPNLIFLSTPPQFFLTVYFPSLTRNTRLLNNQKIGFHLLFDFANIDFQKDNKLAHWVIYNNDENFQNFIIESLGKENVFIDFGTRFQLKIMNHQNKTFFWTMNQNKELTLSEEPPKDTWFIFEIADTSATTTSPANILEAVKKNTKNFESYIKTNFENNYILYSNVQSFPAVFLILLFIVISLYLYLNIISF
jgi:hypothetical protein